MPPAYLTFPARSLSLILTVVRLFLVVTFSLFATVAANAGLFSAPDWPTLKADIRESYPDVPEMSVAELQLKLARSDRVLLLDARDPAEYAVSHLKGAILAPDEKTALSSLASANPGTAIVVYCSVGLRSAILARKLQKKGVANVSNLEGSLFEWANIGLPVFHGDQPAKLVHPYSRKWGELLDSGLRAPLD